MPCNNTNASKRKTSNASYVEPATLWEHFVLHKATEKKLRIFDLEISDKKPKDKQDKNNTRLGKMSSALDAATALIMREHRQRSVSAPAPANVADLISPSKNKTTEAKLPPALLASISAANTLSNTSSNSSATSSKPAYPSGGERIFGSAHQHLLSPEVLNADAERQEDLIRTAQTKGLTLKKRMLADHSLDGHEEEAMMSGALEAGDLRCDVCAARERAMSGLEEAGIVAL